jgi:hypothetical protein
MNDQCFKTHQDGSIDYRFCTERGRTMRSQAAYALLAGIGHAIGLRAAQLIGRAAPSSTHVELDPAAKAKPEGLAMRIG